MTKSISVSEDVYTLLNGIRDKDETFSDVIRRLTGSKGRLMEIVDLYPELNDVSEYEQSVKELRKQIDEALST
ncbi:MAG: antitoxin VapB family protein [Methanosarcinales archaeon]